MAEQTAPSAEPQVTFSSGRVASSGAASEAPDLRILHYNDVYHVDQASAEPVGGLARFMTLCKQYKDGEQYRGQPELVTLFSGDAFNPSLESSVTKGSHMVPVLNAIGTQATCVGNHDLDFGVKQFEHLAEKCEFPWLLANILDPALGQDVPLGNAKRTHIITASNGVKIGLIGLGEREWLATINSLPPNIIYKSASAVAKELVPQLREQGADIIICLSHMREPNDNKLADQTDGIIDIILGGHDHYYAHSFRNGTHVLRSGTDFKQLTYIEARRKRDDPTRWDFDLWRRDVTSEVPEDKPTAELVHGLTSKLQKSLSKPVGWTAMPLDARFVTARLKESNMGNFVCDIMRSYHNADCSIMAGGTIRGDQIYPPGAIRIKDITTCFPFEDPVVFLRVKGQAIWDALENGVSLYPALEGRFPQVSGIEYEFNPSRPSGERILSVKINGKTYEPEKDYTLATRGYMGRGKDGFTSLLVKSEGGQAEEIVDEEAGILISTMLRQYFMALRTVGQWKKLSANWTSIVNDCNHTHLPSEVRSSNNNSNSNGDAVRRDLQQDKGAVVESEPWRKFLRRRLGYSKKPHNDDDDDHHFDPTAAESSNSSSSSSDQSGSDSDSQIDLDILLMRKFWGRWARRAGIKAGVCGDPLKEAECAVDWTRVIAPVLEGRIKIVEA
ncbi:uncharacterized protein TRIREDRAFT_23209 [Trichoderma reesei QM6a]|uniref:Predicted protein n=2 Tax=Hypocrea jecorina TaxID=51453 RepID=G0RTX4_HYPJQ|nr:uncharacterized protein TRIREDRAFT_23209 [Trichoderma reesei QM6a]EGR45350.1 predicted protein [Trichoderma reesei QM6a]ETR98061.1 5'-nucleotidase [Trichoderma reesei RUT C-30]